MSGTAVRPAEAPYAFALRDLKPTWQVSLLFLATALVYAGTVKSLVIDWWRNPDYSHGLLLPFALAYILLQKREKLRAMPFRPAWFGMGVIVVSQVINLVGYLGAEFFLQRFSLLVFLAGLIVFLWGPAHLGESAFALVLLFFAIPLPALIFNAVSLPLQFIASSWAENFLRACQIPVYREGNVLMLSQQTLNVAEACSGIRSLMSLITLGVMIAYFLPFKWWLRAFFVLTTIPVALVANAFRVGGTGVLGRWFGDAAAQGFFHTFSGWLVFVSAFGFLILEVTLLMRITPTSFKERVPSK
jgi:exosortase